MHTLGNMLLATFVVTFIIVHVVSNVLPEGCYIFGNMLLTGSTEPQMLPMGALIPTHLCWCIFEVHWAAIAMTIAFTK